MGSSVLKKLGGVGVAIIVAVVIIGVKHFGAEKIEQSKAPKVGECVNITGTKASPDDEGVDCGDADATFKVVGDDGGCDEAEMNYTISTGSKDSGNIANLCLELNAAKGDCFDNLASETLAASKIACKGANKQTALKVGAVGKIGTKCPKGTQGVENKTRKTVICVGPIA